MKLLLLCLILSSCTWHNYWDVKCHGYIGTYKTLKGDRYINLDRPFVAVDTGAGDSLIFVHAGNGIAQYFHTWDTLGAYKSLTTPLNYKCCK